MGQDNTETQIDKGLNSEDKVSGPEKELDLGQDSNVIQVNKELNTEDNEFGPKTNTITEPITEKNQEIAIEEEQGPPPGYPLPIYQQLDMLQIENVQKEPTTEASAQNKGGNFTATPPCLAVRRSSRLQKKY